MNICDHLETMFSSLRAAHDNTLQAALKKTKARWHGCKCSAAPLGIDNCNLLIGCGWGPWMHLCCPSPHYVQSVGRFWNQLWPWRVCGTASASNGSSGCVRRSSSWRLQELHRWNLGERPFTASTVPIVAFKLRVRVKQSICSPALCKRIVLCSTGVFALDNGDRGRCSGRRRHGQGYSLKRACGMAQRLQGRGVPTLAVASLAGVLQINTEMAAMRKHQRTSQRSVCGMVAGNPSIGFAIVCRRGQLQ